MFLLSFISDKEADQQQSANCNPEVHKQPRSQKPDWQDSVWGKTCFEQQIGFGFEKLLVLSVILYSKTREPFTFKQMQVEVPSFMII